MRYIAQNTAEINNTNIINEIITTIRNLIKNKPKSQISILPSQNKKVDFPLSLKP